MNLPSRRVPYKPMKFWLIRARFLVRSQLARFPLIEDPVIRIWRTGSFLLLKYEWKLVALIGTLTGIYDKALDVDKVCWVSPQRITYCSLREFWLQRFSGRVIGGDWDRLEKRFEDLDIYVAFRQVCMEGKDWTETVFYQRVLDGINGGQILWNCKDQHDLDQRCKYLESLFHKIKREGYKSQRELLSSQKTYDPLRVKDEVGVNIGRHGDLLFNDAAHRLAIAKLVGLQRIPMKITVRHPEWMRFRKEVIQYAKEMGGKTYQPLIHIDFDDIPAIHDDCDDRFIMIKQNMSVERGRLLDIGANLGYFCHRFEDEGFDCYAVEDFPIHLYFLKKLKRAENKEFRVIDRSVLECAEINNMYFDVILALNIFHHFLKTKESYDRFIHLLKNLKTRELFFVSHLTSEPQMQAAYKNCSPDEFAELLVQNSRLENIEFIGTAKDGRSLYKLY